MKEIGIADFEQLVMERLSNPRKFAGRSLVLWNADYAKSGIAYRVIEQCCEKYNEENPNDQVWFKMSSMFQYDDYTQPKTLGPGKKVWCEELNNYIEPEEWKRCGIIFGETPMGPILDDWLRFVNTHTNHMGGVSQDCAVIVCNLVNAMYPVSIVSDDSLKEDQFGENCDIYHIQPTFEEWAKWAEPFCDSEILKVVCAYIEKNGVIRDFDYWLRVMDGLDKLKKEGEYKDCSLKQIPEKKVNYQVFDYVQMYDPAPDFCKFIYSFFENNSQKE